MPDPLVTSRPLPVSDQDAHSAPVPPVVPPMLSERQRREWLIETLGEAFCRKLGVYRIPQDLVLSVVIPAYNENRTIREILDRVRAVPINKQIIVVDDCSTDGTREILRQEAERDPGMMLVLHEVNQGKGACAADRLPARHRRPGDRPGR